METKDNLNDDAEEGYVITGKPKENAVNIQRDRDKESEEENYLLSRGWVRDPVSSRYWIDPRKQQKTTQGAFEDSVVSHIKK